MLAWAKPDQQPPQPPPPPRNTSHSTLPTVLVVDRVCEVEVVRCFVSPRRQVWWLRGEWARTLSEARAAAAAAGEAEEAEGGEQSQPPLVELHRGRNIFGEAAVEVELSFLYGEEDGDSDDDDDGGGLARLEAVLRPERAVTDPKLLADLVKRNNTQIAHFGLLRPHDRALGCSDRS